MVNVLWLKLSVTPGACVTYFWRVTFCIGWNDFSTQHFASGGASSSKPVALNISRPQLDSMVTDVPELEHIA